MNPRATFLAAMGCLALSAGANAQITTQLDYGFDGFQINDSKYVLGQYGTNHVPRVWLAGSGYGNFSLPSPGNLIAVAGLNNLNKAAGNLRPSSSNPSSPRWFDWNGSSYISSTSGSTLGNSLTTFSGINDADEAWGNVPGVRGYVLVRPSQPNNAHVRPVPYYSNSHTKGSVIDVNDNGTVLAFSGPSSGTGTYYIAYRGSGPGWYSSKVQIPSGVTGYGNVTSYVGISNNNEVLLRVTSPSALQQWVFLWTPTGGFTPMTHPTTSVVVPRDISGNGDIVGEIYTPTPTGGNNGGFAIIRSMPIGYIDLRLAVPNVQMGSGLSINNNRDILATGQNQTDFLTYSYVIDYP
jgi:hypothetical protein